MVGLGKSQLWLLIGLYFYFAHVSFSFGTHKDVWVEIGKKIPEFFLNWLFTFHTHSFSNQNNN